MHIVIKDTKKPFVDSINFLKKLIHKLNKLLIFNRTHTKYLNCTDKE